MAIMKGPCRSCGAVINMSVGQSSYDGSLLWHRGYTCPSCGSQIEEDGRNETPEEVRRAILQQEGEWALIVEETGSRATTALKLLRQALKLSINEIGEMRRHFPGALVSGTKVEVNRLLAILTAEAIQASVVELPAATR